MTSSKELYEKFLQLKKCVPPDIQSQLAYTDHFGEKISFEIVNVNRSVAYFIASREKLAVKSRVISKQALYESLQWRNRKGYTPKILENYTPLYVQAVNSLLKWALSYPTELANRIVKLPYIPKFMIYITIPAIFSYFSSKEAATFAFQFYKTLSLNVPPESFIYIVSPFFRSTCAIHKFSRAVFDTLFWSAFLSPDDNDDNTRFAQQLIDLVVLKLPTLPDPQLSLLRHLTTIWTNSQIWDLLINDLILPQFWVQFNISAFSYSNKPPFDYNKVHEMIQSRSEYLAFPDLTINEKEKGINSPLDESLFDICESFKKTDEPLSIYVIMTPADIVMLRHLYDIDQLPPSMRNIDPLIVDHFDKAPDDLQSAYNHHIGNIKEKSHHRHFHIGKNNQSEDENDKITNDFESDIDELQIDEWKAILKPFSVKIFPKVTAHMPRIVPKPLIFQQNRTDEKVKKGRLKSRSKNHVFNDPDINSSLQLWSSIKSVAGERTQDPVELIMKETPPKIGLAFIDRKLLSKFRKKKQNKNEENQEKEENNENRVNKENQEKEENNENKVNKENQEKEENNENRVNKENKENKENEKNEENKGNEEEEEEEDNDNKEKDSGKGREGGENDCRRSSEFNAKDDCDGIGDLGTAELDLAEVEKFRVLCLNDSIERLNHCSSRFENLILHQLNASNLSKWLDTSNECIRCYSFLVARDILEDEALRHFTKSQHIPPLKIPENIQTQNMGSSPPSPTSCSYQTSPRPIVQNIKKSNRIMLGTVTNVPNENSFVKKLNSTIKKQKKKSTNIRNMPFSILSTSISSANPVKKNWSAGTNGISISEGSPIFLLSSKFLLDHFFDILENGLISSSRIIKTLSTPRKQGKKKKKISSLYSSFSSSFILLPTTVSTAFQSNLISGPKTESAVFGFKNCEISSTNFFLALMMISKIEKLILMPFENELNQMNEKFVNLAEETKKGFFVDASELPSFDSRVVAKCFWDSCNILCNVDLSSSLLSRTLSLFSFLIQIDKITTSQGSSSSFSPLLYSSPLPSSPFGNELAHKLIKFAITQGPDCFWVIVTVIVLNSTIFGDERINKYIDSEATQGWQGFTVALLKVMQDDAELVALYGSLATGDRIQNLIPDRNNHHRRH